MDPAAYYARTDNGFRSWEWMHALDTLNPEKAKALLRQSLSELRVPMDQPAQAALRALIDGTADYAELLRQPIKGFFGKLVEHGAKYFGDLDRESKSFLAQSIVLLHARPHGNLTFAEADGVLRQRWMSRCTAAEFANGHD